jgi:protease-4
MPESFAGRIARSYALVVVIGLLVGVAIAPFIGVAMQDSSGGGTVAVVPIEGSIGGQSAEDLSQRLQEARNDPSIKAVVLVSNSLGGSAIASETQYLHVNRTAEEMPVVASVDAAATSGAYFTVVASDHIYTKPSSFVGHVGAVTTRIPEVEPNDYFLTTGPKKVVGFNQRDRYYSLEQSRRVFAGAVFAQRGDRITLSEAEVSNAQIYSGAAAVRYGLADEVGTRRQAVQKAASMAGLNSYNVEVLRSQQRVPTFLSRSTYLASSAPNKTMAPPGYLVGVERQTGLHTLLVPPRAIEFPAEIENNASVVGSAEVTADGS